MTIWQRARSTIDTAQRRHPALVTAVGSAVMFGLLAWVLAGHWEDFTTAMLGVPLSIIGVAALIQAASLVARSECWHVSVRAAGGSTSRTTVYRAASVGYVGNIVNGQLGFAMRIAALRRAAPSATPTAGPLATTEVPILLVEGALAALFSFTLVVPLGLPWYVPLLAFLAMLAGLIGVRAIARHRRGGWWKGLAVMRDMRTRTLIIALITLAMGGQVMRNWMLLQASGVDATVLEAIAVLIAVALLGTLPVGPGTGAGAAVLILGAGGVGAVAAAGVLMTVTSAIGALGYGGWALLQPRWPAALNPHAAVRRRRARASRAAASAFLARLRALPAAQRRVVERTYFGGLDHSQIAAALV